MRDSGNVLTFLFITSFKCIEAYKIKIKHSHTQRIKNWVGNGKKKTHKNLN